MRVTSTGLSREIDRSRASPDAPVQGNPLRHPEPVTTAPGSGSRRQTSSDSPISSISTNPTRRDVTGQTYYPLHGDAQRPNPGHIRLFPVTSGLTPSN